MGMEIDLIPQGTRVEENGFGPAVDIRASKSRTFFCLLTITDQIEQEGETRAVLDLNLVPEVNFIRAGWELNRWGRVAPTPLFVLGLHLVEVPAMPQRVPSMQATAAK
jgi:hypothetical protein